MDSSQLTEEPVDLLPGCSREKLFIHPPRFRLKLYVYEYALQLSLHSETHVVGVELDSRLPWSAGLRALQASLSRPQHGIDVPWVFHNLRHYIEQVAFRRRFFSDIIVTYAGVVADPDATSASEAQCFLRLPVGSVSARMYMILISWSVDLDATGKVDSQLRLALSASQPNMPFFDIDRVFRLLVRSNVSLNSALRTIMNRLLQG